MLIIHLVAASTVLIIYRLPLIIVIVVVILMLLQPLNFLVGVAPILVSVRLAVVVPRLVLLGAIVLSSSSFVGL